MRDFKYVEEEIDRLTYPAKLSTAVKRLLAAKFQELDESFRAERNAIQIEKDRIGSSVVIAPKDLPKAVRPLAKKHAKLLLATSQVVAAMRAQGVDITYGGHFSVKAKEAEITARIVASDKKMKDLTDSRDKAAADLQALAQRLAAAEIKVVKDRIAKADPALVAELDGIGKALLPEPPKPVKALKGKTQKAATNEATHTETGN